MISEIIQNFNTCADAKSAISYMVELQKQNPDLQYKDRNGAYVYENYYILPSYTNRESEFLKILEKNLQIVNTTCKTSSPQLIDIAATKDKKFTAIIYKINDCQNADLIPYMQTKGASQEKIEQFKTEQIELLEKTGLINPEIFNSLEHFYITPDTRTIMFENWGTLVKCELTKKEFFKRNLNSLL